MISTEPRFRSQVAGYQAKHRSRRLWRKIVSTLACLVVFCTTYALILPAITMETPRVLDCPLAVHQHTADCYDADGNLICGQADFVVHIHDESCYDQDGNLVCTLPEIEAHTHTEECYTEERTLICEEEEDPGHTHTEECYTEHRTLICEQEEDPGHTHTRECYTWTEGDLICGLEESETHQHGEYCYDWISELNCTEVERAGHTHTDECYECTEELTCTEEEREPGHVHTDECYETEAVLTCEKEEIILHTHTDACYDEDRNLICGQLEILEHVHTDACFREVEPEESPSGAAPYTYEDSSILVDVTLPADSTVPADAVLAVRPITEEDEDYDYEALKQWAAATVDGTAAQIVLYDISFYTTEGEYLPVDDTATVSIRFKESVLSEGAGEVSVLHYPEEAAAPVALADVDVERDENETLSALTFQTEGFSVFAVVTVTGQAAEAVTPDVHNLNGQSYIIKSNGSAYAMQASQKTTDKLDFTTDDSAASVWTFTSDGSDTNTYYISCGDSYLLMGTDGSLTLTDQTSATVFTVSLDTTSYNDGQHIRVSANGYYINSYGGEGALQGFRGYGSADAGSTLLLYTPPTSYVTDLDGQSYAIVNRASGNYVMTAETFESSGWTLGVPGLKAQSVTVTTNGSATYIMGDNITEWTFHAVAGKTGVYTISTEVEEKTQYLRFLDTKYQNNDSEKRGSLTLGDSGTEVTVTVTSDGKVLLANDGSYVNRAGEGEGFWLTAGTNGNSQHYLAQVVTTGDNYLTYDLNLSDFMSTHKMSGGSWYESYGVTGTAPSLSSAVQDIESGSTLYTVEGSRDTDGYFMYYSAESVGGSRQQLADAGKPYGKQVRFDGWEAEATDGETYLFPEKAQATLGEDGWIHIEDTDGVERTLEPGTTLKGQWTEISDLVLFYVNYSGTILDTEGDVEGRNTNLFTPAIGIGRVYYGALQVGNDGYFGGDANEAIRLKFVNNFNYNDPDPQIVMDFVTVYDADTSTYTPFSPVSGINDTELEKYLLNYIKESKTQIQITSADKNGDVAYIDPDNATPDNYSVRWYVLKEQTDGWHIDGVMVARTAEITVTKNFSGLTQEQVDSILGSFNMPVQLGSGKQDYFTMTPTDIPGQVEYEGQYAANVQSYRWTLHSITGEQYTLSEADYGLAGYDASTMVLQYYTDAGGITHTEYVHSNTTDAFTQKVFGGATTAVSFNNFYTPSGTGAVSILKRAESTEGAIGAALKGAVFTLYDGLGAAAGEVATATTNENGSAFFSGLAPGTYYLRETTAPDGYEQFDGYWEVAVQKHIVTEDEDATGKSVNTDTDGNDYYILVTIQAFDKDGNAIDANPVTCYDGGIITTYVIKNDPKDTTITIVKTFSGLTAAEMTALRTNSAAGKTNPYYIDLTNGADTWTLYLTNAAIDQTGFVYTWTLTDMTFADTTYVLTEYNYLLDTWADTVVTANKTRVVTEQGTENKTTQTIALTPGCDYTGKGTATISGITFDADGSGVNYSNRTINLSNNYTNTFDLKLRKVDSKTGAPLTGASFKVYGPYNQSTNTGDVITYQGTKYYYIGTTAPSGADGYTTWSDLTLSREGDTTFVYFLSEWEAPDGYVKLDEPIYVSVTVNVTGSEYSGGVLSMEAPNTMKKDAKLTLNAEKKWVSYTPTGDTVTLALYRVAKGETAAELISTVTLDGTAEGAPTAPDGAAQAYESAAWVATWTNLPAAETDSDGNLVTYYQYYVREISAIDGLVTTYTCNAGDGSEVTTALTTLTVGTESFQAILIADGATAYQVTVTNTAYFELPQTGGGGNLLLYAIGSTLLLAGGLLYGYLLRRRQGRRYTR